MSVFVAERAGRLIISMDISLKTRIKKLNIPTAKSATPVHTNRNIFWLKTLRTRGLTAVVHTSIHQEYIKDELTESIK